MKTFYYLRIAQDDASAEEKQIESCRTLAESLGYQLIENDGRSQQEKFLERVAIMPKAVLHEAVVTFRVH